MRLAGAPVPDPTAEAPTEARRHIRGSALLMSGRLVSVGINFVIQVLILRYLSREDYGAFAYALSVVLLLQQVADLGLHRSVARFLPIYDERRESDRQLGTLLLVLATIATIGVAGILLAYALVNVAPTVVASAPEARNLLLILIVLAPLQALDQVFEAVLSAIGTPRAIVVRKHFIGPLLKLLVVVLLIATAADATFLAVGYVAAGVLGLLVYVPFLIGTLRRHGVDRSTLGAVKVPARELFMFGLPLLSADVMFLARNVVDVVLVDTFHGLDDVAGLRAVQPFARLNELVFVNFALLFTPIAARLFARRAHDQIEDLYWTTATWQAVLTFPIFLITFGLARPMTMLLDPRYADTAPILALLSLGFFVNAALGQNALTLRVYGRVRYVMIGNLLAAVVSVVLGLLLIRPFGALGAAVAAAVTMIGQNLYNQVGLRTQVGISAARGSLLPVYSTMVIGVLSVLTVQIVSDAWPAAAATAVVASLAVVAVARPHLDAAEVFPELLRLPFARRLLGTP